MAIYKLYKGNNEVENVSFGLVNISKIYKGNRIVYGEHQTQFTFYPSESLQTWVVPNDVNKVKILCVGSQGGNNGGLGGCVECDLKVTPKETLYLMVGDIPSNEYTASYNASDVRIGGNSYSDRIIVAGGGGSTSSSGSQGGAGGGLIGGSGSDFSNYANGGGGGTQSAGGSGGYATHGSKGHHHTGTDGNLGMGGSGSTDTTYEGNAGAGGAGYYGGGSGGACWSTSSKGTAGGGGGSSYTDSSLCLNVRHTQGYQNGNGFITITFFDDPLIDKSFRGSITKTLKSGVYELTLVGPGGSGGSSQRDSKWFQSSGGSGATFKGEVYLEEGEYTFVLGTPGYGWNIDNVLNCGKVVAGTDSYIQYNGTTILTCGCGINGTSHTSGGAGGTLTIGNLNVISTEIAKNGNKGNNINNGSPSSTSGYALSSYDGTKTGYGAGRGSWRGGGNVYGYDGYIKLSYLRNYI